MRMSYVYVDKKLIDMYKEHFDYFNPGKTIFDSMEIQTKVEIAIRWIWEELEKLPPELIPELTGFSTYRTQTHLQDTLDRR